MNVAPISFCNKLAFNVRDDKYKTKLLEKIFTKFNIIVTDNSCQIYNKRYSSLLTKSKYLLSTNTRGNRYFLYFTRDEFENNLCFFIDRKICKGYQYPRIIYTKYRFDDVIFKDTLIHGELIKDYDNNWIFLVNDILSFCGKKCNKQNKIERIKKMYFMFSKYYIRDSILDVCNFQIKRYFEYNDMNYLVKQFIPNLKYNINGVMFNGINFKQPNILLLKHFQNKLNKQEKYKKNNQGNQINQTQTQNLFKIETKSNEIKETNSQQTNKIKQNTQSTTINITKPKPKPKSISEMLMSSQNIQTTELTDKELMNKQYFNFIIERTNQGIFQLTCFINKNKKIFGYARVNSLDKQEMILDLLSQEKYKTQDLFMKCKYNQKFNKFIPVEEISVMEPDQYIDIKKYISLLK